MGLGESFVKKTEDGIRMKFRVCYLLRRQYTSQYAILLTFESREEVGIRLLKFFLKLSDSIPHKSHYVILHSSTDIKSDPLLNPTIILNFRLLAWQLLQIIIWTFMKLSEHQLTDRLWITEILFTNVKCENIFFIIKIFFQWKLSVLEITGNAMNDINLFFHNNCEA